MNSIQHLPPWVVSNESYMLGCSLCPRADTCAQTQPVWLRHLVPRQVGGGGRGIQQGGSVLALTRRLMVLSPSTAWTCLLR